MSGGIPPPSPASPAPSTPHSRPGFSTEEIVRRIRLPGLLICVLIAFGLADHRIVSAANLQNIALQASYLAIFAMAQTMVIIARGFDLSLGFTVSLVSVVASMAMVALGETAMAIAFGLLAGMAVASVIGLANGLLVAGVGINPLVTTLGVANIVMVFASTVSNGFPITGTPAAFTALLAQARLIGVPVPTWIAALTFLLLMFLLKATLLGRSLYIIGANPRAARAAGIRVTPVLTAAYVLCGALAGLGALLLTARTGSGEPNLGGSLTLESIAAAVVGGVRLSGGEGGVGAAVLGAVFITILSNGMNLLQVDGYIQQICLGAIIIVSLILSRAETRS